MVRLVKIIFRAYDGRAPEDISGYRPIQSADCFYKEMSEVNRIDTPKLPPLFTEEDREFALEFAKKLHLVPDDTDFSNESIEAQIRETENLYGLMARANQFFKFMETYFA